MTVLSKFAEGSSSPSSTNRHKHDVFLSFRGVDTRNNFTDHLHKALLDANISTFLDDDEIEAGGDLKPELESAIKESRASIIILSKNYANSSWCLDELVLILEQRMTSNQIVIPIFFHVEPSDIRKQESNFALSMAEHKEKMEAEKNASKKRQLAQKIDRWIKALTEVANLKGMHAKGRRETKFIAEIVEDIYRKLHVPARSAQPLIGMEESIDFVTSWLRDGSSNTGDILTILGMGGIGKTSLAKYVYGLHFREFDTRSYIEDIGRRCAGKYNGLLDLTKQLCDDISKRSPIQVYDVSVYTSKIENVLANKKVFLVLDDINSLDQLDALLGNKGFHPQSKIIITSRNAWLTKSCALFKKEVVPRHAEHWLQGLDKAHSLQLLCSHALKSKDPKPGYEIVLEKFMKYCRGHPLTLEVLGKSLHKRDAAYWEERIEGLGKENDSRIMDVLKMSYDSLPSRNDKELFKHIACFFVGMDRDFCDTILKACDIKTSSGITNLIDRCLLSIGWNNKLVMHQLLQEMGRFIVREESLDKPSEQSRLWCHEDSSRVLKQKKGTENTQGLTLDTRMLKNKRLCKTFELELDALSNMDSLMLLQLNYVKFNGSYKNFPEELRWLCMHGFPLKSIPSDLSMQNLVALDMSYSNIESFDICYHKPLRPQEKKKLLLGSLKILDFSFCEQLRSLGDFDQLPALERLIVIFCIGLLEVSESIEQCVELVFIDLRYCRKLEKLPRSISNLKKVKTMLLNGCNLGNSLIEHKDMDSVEMCKSNKTIGVNTRNSSSAFVGAIAIPSDLKFFSIPLPISLVELSLSNNNLSTESFPMDFSRLSMLKELYLDNNPIHSMPNCVRTLPKLEILDMRYCDLLKSIEYPPRTLRELRLLDDKDLDDNVLQKVVFDPEMSPLRFQFPWRNFESGFYEIEGVLKIHPMEGVEERVLHSLGWTNLLHNKRMFYEFGIFSTMYGAEEMPSWFTHRSVGASMSFTIPSSSSSSSSSSPNNLKALNFCFVLAMKSLDIQRRAHDDFQRLSMVIISNKTKNLTWIYERHRDKVFRGHKCWVVLSHWMFGVNEMEAGDHVTITVTEKRYDLVKECGVSLVYDNGENKDEEDVLAYYKSWNHIIGGDLSPFQLTTGEYILHNSRFFESDPVLFPCHREFVGEDASYQEHKKEWFRALSRRKPDTIIGDECEGREESSRSSVIL